jgi:hypothetical protein
MPSPFPGMDPYLEDSALWPAFQHHLVGCLHQALTALPPRYAVRTGRRAYATGQLPALATVEEYLEIVGQEDGRLVTLLDVVSPNNRTTPAGRQAYLDTRQQARAAGANLVEIDLVLQGQPTLEYSREGLPDWDYAVTVTRAAHTEKHEIYSATLQKRLPRFRLPLAAGDRDVVLDLDVAFRRCYERGGFAQRVDYRREPPVPLDEDDRRWLDDLLKDRRGPGTEAPSRPAETPFSNDEIAVAAYYLWQQDGCPEGRDDDYWRRAVEKLGGA